MLKHLVSTHIIGEKAAGIYIGTPLSDAFVEVKFSDGISFMYIYIQDHTHIYYPLSSYILPLANLFAAATTSLGQPSTHCQHI